MSIDVMVELERGRPAQHVQAAVIAAGAVLEERPGGTFAGTFAGSGMAVFFDRLPVARGILAEGVTSDMQVDAQLSFRPPASAYEAALGELKHVAENLAALGREGFVMSDQYETVLAIGHAGELRLDKRLLAGG